MIKIISLKMKLFCKVTEVSKVYKGSNANTFQLPNLQFCFTNVTTGNGTQCFPPAELMFI